MADDRSHDPEKAKYICGCVTRRKKKILKKR